MAPHGWLAHLPAGSDPTIDLLADSTLPAAWSKRWGADPARPVLHIATGSPANTGPGSGERRWVTAGELDERSRNAAANLAGLELPEQSRVLWIADRSLDSVAACIGVLRAGLVLVPIDTALTDRELRHVISEVAPRVAIVDDARCAQLIAEQSLSSPADITVLGTAQITECPGTGGQVTGGHDTAERPAALDPDAPALIGFTSGTTGAPKGAVLTHANLLANTESLRLAWRWTPDDRLIHALPLFHGHGLCAALFGTLQSGASAVILDSFDPGATLDAVTEHHATLFFGVPTMYHRLAASGRSSELGRLRLSVSGSAPLAADLHHEIERSSGARVLERYGMTETLLTVSNPYEGERRAGSIGFPLPGTDAFFDTEPDPDPDMEDGAELLVSGPTVFAGYFGKPAQTADRFSDGWFRTGDVGVEEDGYVRLLGRMTEVVITGGHNVYPAEVEDVLLGYPDVAEVAVSGTPSDEWGEVVTAWVVASSGKLDVDGLLAHAATSLSNYKRPRIVRQVESLPRNAMGKVMRRSLE